MFPGANKKQTLNFLRIKSFCANPKKIFVFLEFFFDFICNTDSGAYLCSRFGKNVVVE